MEFDTIIGVPFEEHRPLHSMLHDQPEPETPAAEEQVGRMVKIRSADSSGRRGSASVLINRMYATRGYRTSPLPAERDPTRITLVASEQDEVIGTITIGFDSASGLHVDDLFAGEVDRLRHAGSTAATTWTLPSADGPTEYGSRPLRCMRPWAA